MKNITVDKAISKGHKMVNYPVVAILIIGMGITVYLVIQGLNVGLVLLIGFILTFAATWLWWSIFIVKWRIWAFTNVRNVHELKQRAINEQLIWPDGSWFNKTEIRSEEQQRILKQLEGKFRYKDVREIVEDDPTIGYETEINFSNFTKWGFLFLTIGVVGVVLNFIAEEQYVMVLIMAGFAAYSIVFLLPKYFNEEPQVVLNEKKMKTINTGFVEWKKVKYTKVEFERSGKNGCWYLKVVFSHRCWKGKLRDRIEISDLNKSPEEIKRLIKIYRQRYKS